MGYTDLFLPRMWNKLVSYPDSNGINALQPINVELRLRHCTDLQNVQYRYVHRSLFPGQEMKSIYQKTTHWR